MSLIDLYKSSDKARIKEIRQIPSLAVNFVDINSTFQTGFTVNRKPLGATEFTKKALDYFEEKRAAASDPARPDFNRYSPKSGYYKPGKSGVEGNN